ncbi:MAG: hypothetical protein FWH48_10055, partial [Oscillospiraceae bacterium]|nr:hypothetical protein [Oscillospiraceae bacterium]
MKAKKILAAVFAGLLLFFLLACSGEDSGEKNNNLSDIVADDKKESGEDALSVLADLKEADYDGYEFKIWTQNWPNTTLLLRQAPEEEETGEPINDALYRRDRL